LAAIVKSPELRGLVRRVVFTDPIGRLPRRLWEMSPAVQQKLLRRFGADAAVIYRRGAADVSEDLVYQGEPALVSSGKAARELGFAPVAARAQTMVWTLAWRATRLPSRTDHGGRDDPSSPRVTAGPVILARR
jgi:hypothetical protein